MGNRKIDPSVPSMPSPGISPSLMCGNSFRQKYYISTLNQLPIPWYHIDFMDGHFVPNVGLGPNYIRDLRAETGHLMEVHLMCTEPLDWIGKMIEIGVDAVSFHIESTHAPVRCLHMIRDAGLLAGIAFSPATPPGQVKPLLDFLDYVTLMGVEPGFEGQSFLDQVFHKTVEMKQIITNSQSDTMIQVDGGIDLEIGKKLLECGAGILVGGVPTIFSDDEIEKNYWEFASIFT